MAICHRKGFNGTSIATHCPPKLKSTHKRETGDKGTIKSILPLCISILSLVVSIGFSYISMIREYKIEYYESWDVHSPASIKRNPLIPFRFIFHTIVLTNPSTTDSEKIEIDFNNVDAMEICEEDFGIPKASTRLIWNYKDIPQPVFSHGKLILSGIKRGGIISLNMIKYFNANKSEIKLADIPTIKTINSKSFSIIPKATYFLDGTISKLQSRLQAQYEAVK